MCGQDVDFVICKHDEEDEKYQVILISVEKKILPTHFGRMSYTVYMQRLELNDF